MTLSAAALTAAHHAAHGYAHSSGFGSLGGIIARSIIHVATWRLLGRLPLGAVLLLAVAAGAFIVLRRR
ncbi:putative secreted protein with PEP-CTERM sorting signal [Branchiibius hedensis]|uniref:PEP-CTERM protein-sorting domain-containing protein n=1 Tax=Branchiibius hedensis TaxID=672460 RepID=A0A2Y9C1K8_9MICO|nr:hypothetical protein [Branchiibius hedensis]PWJ25690.1 putative secreted protein with PEP-CTERM sorting signal [Branchiibius hedensis]SSA34503.1 PEP-CTERM protein-sorting domain-containing protein [Branchiibius hedensis]